jgi:predicted GNAT family acetyltransferase
VANLKLKQAETLMDAPVAVVALALSTDAYIRVKHYSYNYALLTGNEEVIWVEIGGKVAGFLTWIRQREGRIWYIALTGVAPWARGKGVFKLLRTTLNKMGKKDKRCIALTSLIAVSNERASKRTMSVGSRAVLIGYRYDCK